LTLIYSISIIHLGSQSAKAADIVEAVAGVIDCSTTKDDKERLACFDKAATTLKSAGVSGGPATADTKEIVSSFAPDDYKAVNPDNMHVAPHKFIGKPVELRGVKCFYADRNDYRCLAPAHLLMAVFTKSIGPAAEKDLIESECGAIRKLDSPACRKTIHFVPVEYSEDNPNAFGKRVIVESMSVEIVSSARRKR
jgi:hypothetical protein